MNHYQLKDLSLGMKQELSFSITPKMMDQFREITGDENPLHRDTAYANEHGFAERVVYGMLTASFLSTLAGVYLPGERSLIHSVEVKFVAPVLVGDGLVLRGEITAINEQFSFIEISLSIYNQNNKKVCRGKMQVGVR
ncbi:MaoC/PaaZ C-terminal domain-containing protein [Gehongia tenuis]|uniref:MaoC family dehydratase N-terminal domain-containing protein n=1 Tax=Gehongia tenuis TaxID=2763655 RepID=A0A926HPH9_9FIRM|nr:MaoC/PaaZ C-terminal domain-containing protein [Gehongia tenuis]MBC8530720.1 MaoC family dehydratase N-terminal domain-containing protein [Gehongia tenuis]